MKNKPIDLHNHLFEQLERINDTSIKGEELREEFMRAEAMCKLSAQIISNGSMVINAMRAANEIGIDAKDLPENIRGGEQGPSPKPPKQIGKR